jgi:hypothetical protein
MASSTSKLLLPLTLITPMAPIPGAVAIATIVSSHPLNCVDIIIQFIVKVAQRWDRLRA